MYFDKSSYVQFPFGSVTVFPAIADFILFILLFEKPARSKMLKLHVKKKGLAYFIDDDIDKLANFPIHTELY